MDSQKFSLIIAVVNRGFSEAVMAAARLSGAKGGTILNGRGTGSVEAERFLGMTIEPEKDVIIILAKNSIRTEILQAIHKEAGLGTKGNGLAISLPVEEAIGAGLTFEE